MNNLPTTQAELNTLLESEYQEGVDAGFNDGYAEGCADCERKLRREMEKQARPAVPIKNVFR